MFLPVLFPVASVMACDTCMIVQEVSGFQRAFSFCTNKVLLVLLSLHLVYALFPLTHNFKLFLYRKLFWYCSTWEQLCTRFCFLSLVWYYSNNQLMADPQKKQILAQIAKISWQELPWGTLESHIFTIQDRGVLTISLPCSPPQRRKADANVKSHFKPKGNCGTVNKMCCRFSKKAIVFWKHWCAEEKCYQKWTNANKTCEWNQLSSCHFLLISLHYMNL